MGSRRQILIQNYCDVITGQQQHKCLNMNLASKYEGIVVTSKTQYSCMQKVCCCKCFECCQEEKIMTPDLRKENMQRMIKDFLVEDHDQLLFDPVKLMILIYLCNDDDIPRKHIERCKINPSTGVINYRTDLEFYIPQLCNYIVFYRSLENNYLRESVQNMCRLNFYFAHLYYFYMKSLEKNIKKTQIQVLKPVVEYNARFLKQMESHYKDINMTCLDLYLEDFKKEELEQREGIKQIILNYQTKPAPFSQVPKVHCTDIKIDRYLSIFKEEREKNSAFESNITFFNDLFTICQELKKFEDKKGKVIEYAKIMNEHLPANTYIPFSKNSYRLCNILKIVTAEVRVFSTKERAPVCLCIETYCPAEELQLQRKEKFWTNVEVPITLKMTTFNNRSIYFQRNYQKTAEFKRFRQTSNKLKLLGTVTNILEQERLFQTATNMYQPKPEESYQEVQKEPTEVLQQKKEEKDEHEMEEVDEEKRTENERADMHLKKMIRQDIDKTVIVQNDKNPYQVSIKIQANDPQKTQSFNNSKSQSISKGDMIPKSDSMINKRTWTKLKKFKLNSKEYLHQVFDKMFGQPLKRTKERIAQESVFGNLQTWDIIYVIIKTHDDLKQEQFAMQLIQQFDYIFKLEDLPLPLTTYEVLSMGADRGVIQMVKDAVTFDSLQKTLQTKFPTKLTLKEFFEIYFADDLVTAKETFVKSLAAYSLVMYIIQAKDRHNGNILLHRSGKMFHIDFGFFLSNMPGGGIELERDCPFKLLSDHVEVLDGVDSHYFKKFRQYFFLGFKAIKKHQNKVLMLVKLMYSTSGMTMPCFSKGEATISAMEARLNPKGATNDSMLNEHCQRLINLSLDNWAAKWYDRFQYWAQGIFY